jgi:ribosomal-protein-alanine N-acetyltransferase
MFDNWASDPAVTKFLSWPTYRSVEDAHSILNVWLENYEKPDFYQWAIVLKELNQPIGSIGVVNSDDRVDMVEIGYCIGRNWWGRGIMPEALSAVMEYLFNAVGMQRIEAGHDPDNPASGAVLRKCGLQYEGTLRRRIRSNRGITDVAWYSILKEER